MNFKIKKFSHNQIQVIGLENLNELYSKNFSETAGEFLYTDTVTLNLLCKVSEENEYTILQASFSTHEELNGFGTQDITLMLFDSDGLFRVYHIIMPTTTWLNKYIETFKHSPESIYESVYVTDLEKIYVYENGLFIPVGLDELVAGTIENSTLYTDDLFTFNYDGLKECLAKYSEALLSDLCASKCPNKEGDNFYIRDVLWMAINVIEYLLEQGSFFEALRILNIIHGCGNICPNKSDEEQSSSGCGCHK